MEQVEQQSRTNAVALVVTWTMLYVIGVWYSDVFVLGPAQVTLFWPASGIAFAVVVGLGMRWALITPLAVLIAHATFAHVPAGFIPFSIASNFIGSLAAGWLIGKRPSDGVGPSASRLAMGGAAMATIAAAIGTCGLVAMHMVAPGAAIAAMCKWALGDLLGIACIAPTCLLLTARTTQDPDAPRTGDYASATERAAWSVACVGAYIFVYWVGLQGSPYALGMVAIPLALLLWSAFRFPRLWTAVGTMIAVFVVTSLMGLGLAAFQAPRSMLDVILMLGFLNLFATLPLLLGASVDAQRRGARRSVRLVSELADRQQAELEQLVMERTRQLDEANRQLEQASQTDALTGLRNRRYLARQLPLDLAFYSREAGEPHSPPHALLFALVDIDHFKRINDTYGHKAGDDVLQQFAERVQRLIRSCDYAVRWGGEEFLLVLRPMPSEHVAMIGERICTSIAAEPFDLPDGSTITVTCSVGFAEQHLGTECEATGWERLVERADAGLYWAKQNGRNRWAMLEPFDIDGAADRSPDATDRESGLIAPEPQSS